MAATTEPVERGKPITVAEAEAVAAAARKHFIQLVEQIQEGEVISLKAWQAARDAEEFSRLSLEGARKAEQRRQRDAEERRLQKLAKEAASALPASTKAVVDALENAQKALTALVQTAVGHNDAVTSFAGQAPSHEKAKNNGLPTRTSDGFRFNGRMAKRVPVDALAACVVNAAFRNVDGRHLEFMREFVEGSKSSAVDHAVDALHRMAAALKEEAK